MNKRKFLQMLGCLPFFGVAAAKSLNGMELVTDKDVLASLDWDGSRELWYVGPNQRAKYRWVATEVNADDFWYVEDMDDGVIIERIDHE